MKLLEASQIAVELVSKLIPYCDKIEVAGSIRRGKGEVRDIDIVAIPNEEKMLDRGFFGIHHVIGSLSETAPHGGAAYIAFSYHRASVDLYLADASSWGTLLLIRTGSKEHNINLCTMARDRGWHLHASGEGLFDGSNRRIAGDTEAGIFAALGLPFIPPGRREGRYPAVFRRTTPQAKEKILDITT